MRLPSSNAFFSKGHPLKNPRVILIIWQADSKGKTGFYIGVLGFIQSRKGQMSRAHRKGAASRAGKEVPERKQQTVAVPHGLWETWLPLTNEGSLVWSIFKSGPGPAVWCRLWLILMLLLLRHNMCRASFGLGDNPKPLHNLETAPGTVQKELP